MDGQTDPNPYTVEGECELASICWDEVTKHTKQYAKINGHLSRVTLHGSHVTFDICDCCGGQRLYILINAHG